MGSFSNMLTLLEIRNGIIFRIVDTYRKLKWNIFQIWWHFSNIEMGSCSELLTRIDIESGVILNWHFSTFEMGHVQHCWHFANLEAGSFSNMLTLSKFEMGSFSNVLTLSNFEMGSFSNVLTLLEFRSGIIFSIGPSGPLTVFNLSYGGKPQRPSLKLWHLNLRRQALSVGRMASSTFLNGAGSPSNGRLV